VVAERHRAGLVIVNGQDSPFSPGDIRAGDVDSRGRAGVLADIGNAAPPGLAAGRVH